MAAWMGVGVGDAEVREDGGQGGGDTEVGEARGRADNCRRQGRDHSLLACLAKLIPPAAGAEKLPHEEGRGARNG